ncbi:hypothetical protein D3C72_1123840 [compost metagenome]
MRGPFTRFQRAAGVVEGLGLDHDDAGFGALFGHDQIDPGDQAPARGAAQQLVHFDARLLQHLQPHRALTLDDEGIVEGRDQDGAALRCDLGADGFAALGPAVVEAHLAAEGAHAFDLHRRTVRGHDDQGAGPDRLSRRRHPLRVIA